MAQQPTNNAAGPPDGHFISLGSSEVKLFDSHQAHVVLDLGPSGIADGQGDDLYLYEGGNDGPETVLVYGSDVPFPGSWTLLGAGQGNCSFNLSDVDLQAIRYIRIENPNPPKWVWQMRQNDGYDLDAVGKPYVPEADDDDDADDDDTEDDDDDFIPVDDDDSDDPSGPILDEDENEEDESCCG